MELNREFMMDGSSDRKSNSEGKSNMIRGIDKRSNQIFKRLDLFSPSQNML